MPAYRQIAAALMPEDIKKLGIIAGGGVLPRMLRDACQAQNITPYIVGFKQFTDQVTPDYFARMGSSQKTLEWLRFNDVQDLVFIGSLKRPSLWQLWPDFLTIKFLLKSWFKSRGDSDLLSAIRSEIEFLGFKFYGVHKFLPELLMAEGRQGVHAPNKAQQEDIALGVQVSQELGARDIGQAVLVKAGKVIAREDKRGTNAMIARYGEDGAILVKSCKPQQDMDLDLPTIGPQTIELCAEKKMAGIVGHAEKSIFLEAGECTARADKAGMFIMGVAVP
ncbi:MAG: UDP-2,3-diacylglucosamine diphosphatase LpxI [Alphaproteobacteria bacterium]|nr:UDP-2,3-diacylglucosamine diphosphatase LpxI [Alphaproteobacteria bacterium]